MSLQSCPTLCDLMDGNPTSEVRGRSREDPMPEGQQPRGVTPYPRSGAAAESTRLRWCRNGQEELPRVRGQGGRLRGDTQSQRSGVATRGVTPCPRSGAVAGRSYPTPLSQRPGQRQGGATHARGQGRPREELPRVQGQGPRSGGDTPCLKPRARGHGQEELPHAPKPEAKGSGGEEQRLD